MILFFSGTGMSRHVARILARQLEDETVDLGARMKAGDESPLLSERPYVVVAPVYAWRIPRFVEAHLAASALTSGREAYFVLTCGGGMGGAAAYTRAFAQKKGLSYKGTAEIVMPDNYIVMLRPPAPEQARAIIADAEPRVRAVGETILRGGQIAEARVSSVRRFASGPFNAAFCKLFLRLKRFRATDACTGCGWCVRACPANNIALSDRRPAWSDRCVGCLSCVNGCPEHAIEHGRTTIGKHRVYLRD